MTPTDADDWVGAATKADQARLSTWSGFVGPLADLPVSTAGQRVLNQAVDLVRGFFGDEWLAQAVAAHAVPMMNNYEWPLTHERGLVGFLELAARIAVLEPTGVLPMLRAQLRQSRSPGEFEHLRAVLEVASLARREGWSVEVEPVTPKGARPDLVVTKGDVRVQLEVTLMGRDRDTRAATNFGHAIASRRWSVERAHRVQCVVTSEELLDNDELDEWFRLVTEAAADTEVDGQTRVVMFGTSEIAVLPLDAGVEHLYSGPVVTGDAWARIDTRLRHKAERTEGGGLTWLRLDVPADLFMLTSLNPMSPSERLAAIQGNVSISLAGASHIAGVVFSCMSIQDDNSPATFVGEMAAPSALWLPDSYARAAAVAHGPALLLRTLPGGRARMTYVLAGQAGGAGGYAEPLGLGNWYDQEPNWLRWALDIIGWPTLDNILNSAPAPAHSPS